jgi:ADP-heptose:LPS heptosyltransferase
VSDYQSPVVFFANGYGDCLLNLPAIRAFGARFPGRLTLLTTPDTADLFYADAGAARVVEVPMSRCNVGRVFDAEAAARSVGSCDLFLSMVPWSSPSLESLVKMLAPQHSVGFFDYFDVVLSLNYRQHSSELAFDVVRSIDPSLRLTAFAAGPAWPPRVRDGRRRILTAFPEGTRFLATHNETLPAKMWPLESHRELLNRFLTDRPDWVALVLAAHPKPVDVGPCADRIIPLTGLALGDSLAIAESADLFVGVDSCMLHAADLGRVPSVGLFGPTNPDEFGFLFAPHCHVVSPNGAMASIDVDRVLRAMTTLLASDGTPQRH